MERTCIKCGHRNAAATGGELEDCPACGAIYSRVTYARARTPARPASRASRSREDATERTAIGWLGLIVEIIAWVAALVGGVAGALQLSEGLAAAESAPQQAAAAAMAVASAAIPYCIARAVQQLRRMEF